MDFKGISRIFSTNNKAQYKTIGAFWDELSKLYGMENLCGLGYRWTENSIHYAIGLKDGDIDGWNINISLPNDGWKSIKGKTKNLDEIYSDIYKDGPLKYEIETFDENENCIIYFLR